MRMNNNRSTENSHWILAITRNSRFMGFLAWLLALSFAGGSDLIPVPVGGATLYLFRFVVLVGGFLAVVDSVFARSFSSRWFAALLGVMLVWLLWCFMPWYTISDSGAFRRDVFYLIIGLSTVLSVQHLMKVGAGSSLTKGFIAGFLVNVALGVLQVLTSIQPESSHVHALEQFSSEHFVRFAPVGMFGNPNHFAFYLMVNLLLLAYVRKQLNAVFTSALALLAGLLIFLTASKLSMLSWLLLCFYVIVEERKTVLSLAREHRAIVLATLALGLVLLTTVDWRNTRELALKREHIQVVSDSTHKTSYDTRGGLVVCAMSAIKETGGLGLGPGQFTTYLNRPECAEKTGGMVNAHSGVLEIVAQYGLFILLLFSSLYLALPIVNLRSDTFAWSVVYLASLVLLQAANSSFLSSPVAWVMLSLPLLVMNIAKPKS